MNSRFCSLQPRFASAQGGRLALLVIWLTLAWTAVAAGQLRVVTYNTLQGPRADMDVVLQAIGEHSAAGIAKPIDVLLLQEQTGPTGTTQAIVNVLNGIYGAGTYDRGTRSGLPTFSDIRQGIIYNTETVELLQEIGLGSTGSTIQPRQVFRYRLRAQGYGSEGEFYVYNSHYLAGDEGDSSNSTTVGARRQAEAQTIRDNTDDVLGEGAAALYVGDFNMDSSDEQAFQTLLSEGPGQAFDPVSALGDWHNNSSFARWHSQSPCENGCTPGFASGGMDDRFDFQLVTGELLDGAGLDYIPSTYRTFGNNGSTFNDAINVGNTIILSGVTSFTTAEVLDALESTSDHLPVVADYQVPAVMEAEVAVTPQRMIVASNMLLEVTVENTAPAVAPNGAAALNYDVTTSGGLVLGTILDQTDPALDGGNLHTLFLNAGGVPGAQSGSIRVTASSSQVLDGEFEKLVNVEVVEGAAASFAAEDKLDRLTIEFGQVAQGGGPLSTTFELFNLLSPSGFTAALDLNVVEADGDTSILSSDVAAFAGLEAGSSQIFSASLETTTAGSFSSTYTLEFSDEAIPGAGSQTPLVLTLLASVGGPLVGDYNSDGIVSAADFTSWRDTLGQMVAPGTGADGSGNGTIDRADFGIWKTAFSDAARGAAQAVPEPGTGWLVSMTLLFAAACRRFRMTV